MADREDPAALIAASERRIARQNRLRRMTVALLATIVAGVPAPVLAETAEDAGLSRVGLQQDVVAYDASFFDRYRPNTALEMVRRIPGFIIDDGGDKRGFGAAVGNILINDRYPSAKQDTPSGILKRIPADQVERIDLIRGQVRGIDLRGQALVASIILHRNIPASGRWDLELRKIFGVEPMTLRGSISVSDTWRGIEYLAGANYRRFRSGETGSDDIHGAGGDLILRRSRETFLRGDEGNVSVGFLGWIGETVISANSQFAFEDRLEVIDVISQDAVSGDDNDDFFSDDGDSTEIELGADLERTFDNNLLTKALLLYTRDEESQISSQQTVDNLGNETLFRVADSNTVQSESIARTEIYWTPNNAHSLNFNLEAARNVIDGELAQTVDTGSGPVDVPVPGGNTRVQEDRFDVLFNWTTYFGTFETAYGIGAEASTISQTGDIESDRSFFFLKPQFHIAYSPNERRQTRFRLAREVAQLDFADFVSSTIFQDDDVAFGNPELEPQSTWIAELSEERRFGELGVVKVALFYNDISDVQDLLPLSPEFEAPGNIGSGKRWGARFESTLPLEAVGLRGGRLDIEAVVQDSRVTDPVTGANRILSSENDDSKPLKLDLETRYAFALAFRQDFEGLRFAWGSELRRRGVRTEFRVNELVRYSDGYEFNLFAETTRWLGLKIRIDGINLLDFEQVRDRTIYVGERGVTPIDVIENRDITDGRRVIATVSGSF